MNTISRRGFLTAAVVLPGAAIAARALSAFAPATLHTPLYPAMDLSHFDTPILGGLHGSVLSSLHTLPMEHREPLTAKEVYA